MINTRRRMTLPHIARGPVIAAALLLGAAASFGAPAPVAAQISIPSITAPKQAAQRAAAATNAQTAAMQDVGAPPPTQPGRAGTPSAQAPHAVATPIKMTTPPVTPKPTAAVAESHPVPAAPKGPVAPVGTKGPAAPVDTKVATAGAKPVATTAAGPGKATAVGDSAGNSISVTQRGTKGEVSLNREVFSYDAGARRDPFISLMRSGDLRPMLSDLRLVTVLYDATGQNSIAVLRDQSTKDQYRARVGTTLGRMRVVQIQPKQVVFTIEEVGFSRQEALALGDTSKARTP